MGCAGSIQAGGISAAVTVKAPAEGSAPPKPADEGSFVKDLGKFIVQLIKDPEYKEKLIERITEDPDPQNQVEKLLKMFLVIMESVKQLRAPKSPLPDFICGCLVAFLYHLSASDKTPEKITEHKFLVENHYHVDAKYVDAVYDLEEVPEGTTPTEELSRKLREGEVKVEVTPSDIVHFTNKSQLGKPAHAIILDHARKHVMVVVRGTQGWRDMITDAAGAAKDWMDGYAHTAVADAAGFIYNTHKETLLRLVRENPGYTVRTTGHSLGGGTAGCIALLMHRDRDFVDVVYRQEAMPARKAKGTYRITSVGFGSAATMSKELTEETHPYITTVINDSDLVPRLSLNNICDLVKLGDNMFEVFKLIAADVKKLLNKEMPEGYDRMKLMKVGMNLVKDPTSVLKDMVEEKLEIVKANAGEEEVDEDFAARKLYAPGRVLYMQKPKGKDTSYTVYRGSMALACDTILLKGSMLKDHSVVQYRAIVLTGTVAVAA